MQLILPDVYVRIYVYCINVLSSTSVIYREYDCWFTCNYKSVISITSVTLDLPDKMG